MSHKDCLASQRRVTVNGPKAVELSIALAAADAAADDDGDDDAASASRADDDGASGAARRISQYYMDSTNALYDTIWRDLAARGELSRRDAFTYDLDKMASGGGGDDDESGGGGGRAYVEAAFEEVYAPMQRALLAPRAFDGGVVEGDGGASLTLTFEMAVPSVMLLVIESGA